MVAQLDTDYVLFERCHLSEDDTALSYAQRTIRAAPSKGGVDLVQRIAPLFHETMEVLGYT